MRPLGLLVMGCLALAVAHAVAQVLALVLLVGALATFAIRPRETIALVTTLGVLNLVALFPLPALGIVGGLIACRILSRKPTRNFWRSRRRNNEAKLLIDHQQREHE